MQEEYIEICGKTPQCNLPKFYDNYPCKEICKTCKLNISDCKPDMVNILKLSIKGAINKFNILSSPSGKKLVVYGIIHMEIFYRTDAAFESVQPVYFDTPICTVIMIDNSYSDISNINVFIEDVFIEKVDLKQIFISVIALIYPVFQTKEDDNIDSNKYLSSLNVEYDMNSKNNFDDDKNLNYSNEKEFFESEWE